MPDLLVKLYDRPQKRVDLPDGIIIRPVRPHEISYVAKTVGEVFADFWADEFTRGAQMTPIGSLIAVDDGKVAGFACFDCSGPGFFGPTGVLEAWRGRGIGAALLQAALDGLAAKGYAYAIIGAAGPVEYYERLAGATVIEDSDKRYLQDRLS
ncbi:MAG: GNAT family N-acetyltransferase [Pseudomonadota bacterium]